MAGKTQTFATHRRYHPTWHFLAFPVLLINVIVTAWHVVRQPAVSEAWGFVVALGILAAVFAARVQTLTVQNRVIRLEMQMHLRNTLPAALHGRIAELSVGQLIGLRFAGDAELPSLVERCLKGELKDAESVKKQIRDWRPDFLRA